MTEDAGSSREKIQIRYTRNRASNGPVFVQGALSGVSGRGPHIIVHLYTECPCMKERDEVEVDVLGPGMGVATGPEQPIVDKCLERNIVSSLLMSVDVAEGLAELLTDQARMLKQTLQQQQQLVEARQT